MPKPQPVVSYHLKDHRGILAPGTGSVYPFPGGEAVLPIPMHTIDAAQHPQKPVLTPVHIQQSLAIFGSRLPKIPIVTTALS